VKYFDSPRLQKFAKRNFVLSEPSIQGESKGKIAMCYAYILRCSDDSYSVGSSDDPDRRLIEHNQGKGSDWTAARRPVALVWTEEHSTLSSARKRENQIKRWNRAKKDALVGGSLRLRSGRA
jgi:putative endonuclease